MLETQQNNPFKIMTLTEYCVGILVVQFLSHTAFSLMTCVTGNTPGEAHVLVPRNKV